MGLTSTLTKAFSQQGVMQQPDLQRNLLELLVLLDTASSSEQFAHNAGGSISVQLSPVAAIPGLSAQHEPANGPADVNPLLSWSLRSAHSRQLPQGVMALVAESDAAQERSSKATLRTEARLAALQSGQGSSLEGLQLLGGSFGQGAAAASNIQLLVGLPLGTGLQTLSSGHPGASARSSQQPAASNSYMASARGRLACCSSCPGQLQHPAAALPSPQPAGRPKAVPLTAQVQQGGTTAHSQVCPAASGHLQLVLLQGLVTSCTWRSCTASWGGQVLYVHRLTS